MIRNKFCDSLHAEKYRGDGESFRESCNRVAGALADDSVHYRMFRDALLSLRFLPAGRIQAAMGAPKRVTPYNCFVAPTINDSFVDGENSIMDIAKYAAATMRMGGGIGYDFSTLRPRGAKIRKLGSRSSGPLSFMEIFNAVCECVASSGHRRGAQMGILRVDHPDIVEFIHAKQNENRLRGFNLSIAVTDEFMHAVANDEVFKLTWGGQVYSEIDARALWDKIMRSTWDWAEPGVVFIDRINAENNLWYCESIAATNPCGEQPLPPNGACLLGSFNLAKYIQNLQFDFVTLREDIAHVVRAMDNVVDRAAYPLVDQEIAAKNTRRMGLGVTGAANAIEAVTAEPYGSLNFCSFLSYILEVIRDTAYETSIQLAKEKGPFPLFSHHYGTAGFASRLPSNILDGIRKHGIRNSHLLSIAPTGTISLCADNVSSGIEPVFAYEYDRTIQTADGPQTVKVRDYGAEHLGYYGTTADQVSAKEHVRVLTTAARMVDSAVSKTCNVSPHMEWEDFKNIYVDAFNGGAKGCTTFNVGGKRFGVLATNEDGAAACRIDPETGRRSCE